MSDEIDYMDTIDDYKESIDDKSERILYLTQLLIILPYPDMSMVFNVIAFSSTLYAFFFGTAFNNAYRPVSHIHKRNIHFLMSKFKRKLANLKLKFFKKKQD